MDNFTARLDEISPQWSMLFEAHGSDPSRAARARDELLGRYARPILRYLLGATGQLDRAEELAQQFALAFLEGRLQNADPGSGRFRDYVRTILINLVRRERRRDAERPLSLDERLVEEVGAEGAVDSEEDAERRELARLWREETLELVWSALRGERPLYHDLLRLRVEHPQATSRELGELHARGQPTARGVPLRPDHVRKTLERAHTKFAELLVAEVASAAESPSATQLREDLEELDLLRYCRTALDQWTLRHTGGAGSTAPPSNGAG